ncbi:protein lin-9 homolog [Apostichopus japonicus]|uniref:protein lin-9 homolog n=1 Tax=Stichopus japonicus TaxID=307972 RepID=UPI003AB6E981
MADESLEHSAEALMSLRSGGKSKPSPTKTSPSIPRRDNPPRIRKKNRRIFNDDEDTSMSPIRSSSKKLKIVAPVRYSPKTASQASTSRSGSHPTQSPIRGSSSSSSSLVIPTTPVKKAAQKLGARLKNLLKLPKAYKWCIHEWFYSNLDKPLFEGDNDFCICLQESFPQLKTRKLTRTEWCMIRRLMGKPRRCSPAFFKEEREALRQKRRRLRLLQQRKNSELRIDDLKELPDEVPLPLCIGTKVTARLRKPHDGLFTGQVDALDTFQCTYRITFDRQGFGTHSIPDTEVLNNEEQETMPLATFLQKEPRARPPYLMSPDRFDMMSLPSPGLDSDPMLGMSPLRGKLQGYGETLGGFPITFLKVVTRLSKILAYKRELIAELGTMNTEAERLNSLEQPYTMEFKQQYANKVLELDQLNEDLTRYLNGVQNFCQALAPELNVEPPCRRTEERQECEIVARRMVDEVNRKNFGVQDSKLCDLIVNLTALMLQVKSVATHGDMDSFGFKAITDFIEDIKKKMEPASLRSFQDNVEVHMAHIQTGMTQMGNLHAFTERGYLC